MKPTLMLTRLCQSGLLAAACLAQAAPPADAPSQRPSIVSTDADEGRDGHRAAVREGSFITARRGRLGRLGRDWAFFFDADASGRADAPMILFPGQRLMEMQRLVESRPDPITFQLSGEVFQYRQRNYLMPLFFSVVPASGRAAPPPPEQPAPATPDQPEPANPDNPSVAELMRGVERASSPRREPLAPAPSVLGAGGEKPATTRREGEFLKSRRARIIRAPGGAWRAHFDTDADSPPGTDPPMTLLPSLTLERLERLAESAGGPLPVTVSGQVLLYDGENYLLPTLFVVEFADASGIRTAQ